MKSELLPSIIIMSKSLTVHAMYVEEGTIERGLRVTIIVKPHDINWGR